MPVVLTRVGFVFAAPLLLCIIIGAVSEQAPPLGSSYPLNNHEGASTSEILPGSNDSNIQRLPQDDESLGGKSQSPNEKKIPVTDPDDANFESYSRGSKRDGKPRRYKKRGKGRTYKGKIATGTETAIKSQIDDNDTSGKYQKRHGKERDGKGKDSVQHEILATAADSTDPNNVMYNETTVDECKEKILKGFAERLKGAWIKKMKRKTTEPSGNESSVEDNPACVKKTMLQRFSDSLKERIKTKLNEKTETDTTPNPSTEKSSNVNQVGTMVSDVSNTTVGNKTEEAKEQLGNNDNTIINNPSTGTGIENEKPSNVNQVGTMASDVSNTTVGNKTEEAKEQLGNNHNTIINNPSTGIENEKPLNVNQVGTMVSDVSNTTDGNKTEEAKEQLGNNHNTILNNTESSDVTIPNVEDQEKTKLNIGNYNNSNSIESAENVTDVNQVPVNQTQNATAR